MSEITLKEYIEALIEEKERALHIRLGDMDKALILAERQLEKETSERKAEVSDKLKELNQLRRDVITDRDELVRKDIFEPWRDTINSRLTMIETRSITWTAVIGVIFMLVNVILYWFRK